jgi:competence protein ComEA
VSEGGIRDRLAMLSRGELVALGVVLLLTLGGAGLWYARSLPRPVEVRTFAASSARGIPAATTSPSAAPLIVDVAGAVRRPGVYEFRPGERVIDAIKAAGGATGKASLESLNLAAPLTDGAQILVPRDVPPAATASGSSTAPGPTTLINVNTATAAELDALPGVGEVIAQRIVDYRTANGPFATVEDLIDVSGIGPSTMDDIRDLVTV